MGSTLDGMVTILCCTIKSLRPVSVARQQFGLQPLFILTQRRDHRFVGVLEARTNLSVFDVLEGERDVILKHRDVARHLLEAISVYSLGGFFRLNRASDSTRGIRRSR